MKNLLFGVISLAGVLALTGCSTTRGSASLENRVQSLESKVQMLEGGSTSSASIITGAEVSEKIESSVTVDTISKKQIQKALKNAGYYDGPVDGKVGQKTKAAIMEFQEAMGLKADGIAGRNTKEKLIKYLL